MSDVVAGDRAPKELPPGCQYLSSFESNKERRDTKDTRATANWLKWTMRWIPGILVNLHSLGYEALVCFPGRDPPQPNLHPGITPDDIAETGIGVLCNAYDQPCHFAGILPALGTVLHKFGEALAALLVRRAGMLSLLPNIDVALPNVGVESPRLYNRDSHAEGMRLDAKRFAEPFERKLGSAVGTQRRVTHTSSNRSHLDDVA